MEKFDYRAIYEAIFSHVQFACNHEMDDEQETAVFTESRRWSARPPIIHVIFIVLYYNLVLRKVGTLYSMYEIANTDGFDR